jgi:hypothetical protein
MDRLAYLISIGQNVAGRINIRFNKTKTYQPRPDIPMVFYRRKPVPSLRESLANNRNTAVLLGSVVSVLQTTTVETRPISFPSDLRANEQVRRTIRPHPALVLVQISRTILRRRVSVLPRGKQMGKDYDTVKMADPEDTGP